MQNLTQQKLNSYREFRGRADKFIDEIICSEDLPDYEDYIPGSHQIKFYHKRLSRKEDAYVESFEDRDYEKAIIERLNDASDRTNVLITIGALGSGKTTSVKEIARILETKLLADSKENSFIFQPIVIPCIHLLSYDNDPELNLLESLLSDILSRIVKFWLQEYQVKNVTFSILKCLILIDTIRTWSFSQKLHNYPRTKAKNPLAELPPQEILSIVPGEKKYTDKIVQLNPLTNKILDYYDELTKNVSLAKDAVACSLGFLDSKTNNFSLPKVVIVDNLDQLPTTTIQKIITTLYSISAINPKIKFLIPLRPSSLGTYRYTQNFTYIYHQGPCTYYLIYHRIKKYILSKSRDELCGNKISNISPCCKSTEEVTGIIAIAFVYACLMLTGSKKDANPSAVIQEVRKEVHKDHIDIINTVNLPSGTLKSVSSIIGAIVGLSGRFAVFKASQFFNDFYNNYPDLLLSIFQELTSDRQIRISYKRLVNNLFFSNNKSITLGGFLNLFSPIESVNNPKRASLIKLRILSHLESEHSMSIGYLVSCLARYGVPTDVVIRTLLTLHDERRRLVWFSSNEAVNGIKYSGEECAVLSEQGMRYLLALAQNFDYLWVCSAQIRGETGGESNFPNKFSRYIFLVRDLLEIEFKQNSFFVCGDQESVSPVGTPHDHLTLRLLLRSIPQAVESSNIAFAVADKEGTQYIENLATYLVLVVSLLRQAIAEYNYCFDGPYYILHYKLEIDESIKVLSELLKSRNLNIPEKYTIKIEDGIELLIQERQKYKRLDASLIESPISPDLDVNAEIPSHEFWLLPLRKLQQIDSLELNESEKLSLKNTQNILAHILNSRMPRFQEISARIRAILDQLSVCLKTSEQMRNSEGKINCDWLAKEHHWWQEVLDQLEATNYSLGNGKLTRDQADLAKNHFNSRVKLICRLCLELGASPAPDLQRALWA